MRLIDADELKEDLRKYFTDGVLDGISAKLAFNQILHDIDNAPTVEERQQGTWEQIRRFNKKGRIFLNCTQCNYGTNGEIICELPKIPNFCPNCGARMTKGETDDNSEP